VMFAGNAAFLVSSGIALNTWTKGFYPESSAMRELASKVGTAIVGVDDGRRNVQTLSAEGFFPELNIAYRIDEFAGHDPLLPQAYFQAFAPAEGHGGLGLFVLSVTSVAQAHQLGISWLLLPARRAAPAGTSYVATLAGERLYHVPGSAQFSLQPAAGGKVTSVDQPVAGSYALTVSDTTSTTLIARVTYVPGWHASIDGRPATLHPYDDVMQSLTLPAGRHEIRLWYEPRTLFDGGVVAVVAALGLVAFGFICYRRGRTRSPDPLDDGLSISAELESLGPP
jgi:hypothetical protein